MRYLHKFTVIVQILGVILGICCILIATNWDKNINMYSN